jgi:hypothetical protein
VDEVLGQAKIFVTLCTRALTLIKEFSGLPHAGYGVPTEPGMVQLSPDLGMH